MKEFNKKVGAKVKELREQNKVTRAQIAELLEVNVVQIINYEAGRSAMPIVNLVRICAFLNCQYTDMLPPMEEIEGMADRERARNAFRF